MCSIEKGGTPRLFVLGLIYHLSNGEDFSLPVDRQLRAAVYPNNELIMADQINGSGIPGSSGSVPSGTTPEGQTNEVVEKKQYDELFSKFGEQGRELGEVRQFVQEISPLLEKLNASPQLVQAIVEGKVDNATAAAALAGTISLEQAQVVTEAHKEVKQELGKDYKGIDPNDIARLVDEKVAEKIKEIDARDEMRSFESRTNTFIEETKDFADYATQIDDWLDQHPEVVDVAVAYYAVKGELTEKEAKRAAEEAAAEAAKDVVLTASGGGVTSQFAPDGTPLVDKLIAGRTNPNTF